jgi:hypothetical protein
MTARDAARFEGGPLNGQTIRIGWPPEHQIVFNGGGIYVLDPERTSKLTDEQVEAMSGLLRGAMYVWHGADDDDGE